MTTTGRAFTAALGRSFSLANQARELPDADAAQRCGLGLRFAPWKVITKRERWVLPTVCLQRCTLTLTLTPTFSLTLTLIPTLGPHLLTEFVGATRKNDVKKYEISPSLGKKIVKCKNFTKHGNTNTSPQSSQGLRYVPPSLPSPSFQARL